MEAGNLLGFIPLNQPPQRLCVHSRRLSSFLSFVTVKASISSQGGSGYRGPKPRREWIADWVSKNDDFVRSLPIYVGGLSLLAVLFNRTVSGIAPVSNASSSQSRADLLTLGLAVTNILNGLVWLSIRPKTISVVNPNGVECQRVASNLPDFVTSELLWAWDSLSAVTCCRSLVIVYDGKCILQIGFAAASSSNGSDAVAVDTNKMIEGSLYQGVLKSASQSYLANLSLYPGKSQLPFLPSNTQAWITLIGEKLDATLTKVI
ncbi:protein COFACTOR ASSEMBLY OF COMPLEX C SUBUNIT B CCB4, chloroplastic isoform X2 [Nicotiana sylvestris]|uniref:Protein COFACTOR ASSEMBLY OF COMPLEX C SUBUNIT B CCB4, chloroplastic isoform X2 n=2 Tax=Nicotiana TaxID=4085 RepID=A0A1S4ALH7_TOBAC|nr:PREDICTED: uncharacterized protein LOC104215849 isoform X2 [Nicotiana sylvestris]XP_016477582.1 PREDICTED: protein COFACTOR ASSEMBLY OF COMPLEX C SUBUNIT B CCB4, chloroplastic-like isoform X2 [Nicotiana tabacum]